ncbi:hypothetical protein Q361_1205 [Flavobacterium croceum DSM 17960]|uniref:Uncharacterized protein n=1 Tax=Flavobacterium croceum DSM 17960 TaxID=1121886 RepID=A0A2S4N587_9FLAO|nr:hypothetical protein Q361_1205 [Flavobacterium croceum DSM 17960]
MEEFKGTVDNSFMWFSIIAQLVFFITFVVIIYYIIKLYRKIIKYLDRKS